MQNKLCLCLLAILCMQNAASSKDIPLSTDLTAVGIEDLMNIEVTSGLNQVEGLGLKEETKRKLLRDNAAELFGL